MPRIREFTAETLAGGFIGGRAATGSDFSDSTGLRQLAGAAGAVQEQLDRDDVTNVRVQMAKTRAEWDVKFRERAIAADPNDKEFASRFVQEFSDSVGEGRAGVQTRAGRQAYDLLAGEITGHFTEKAGTYQLQLAGVKARQDWEVSQRAYATSVTTDPTSYLTVRDQALAELRDRDGQYGRLDAKTRGDLEIAMRDTLAKSYANGLINSGAPELALKLLDDGRLDDQLAPAAKQTLIRAAEAGITAKRVAADHAEAAARRAEKAAVAAVNDDLMGRFVEGKLTVDDVRAAGIPAFGEGSQATWVSMLRQQAKEWDEKPVKTNPSAMVGAFERIDLPAGDPRKITSLNEINKLYVNKQVSWADLTHLQKAFKDQQTEGGQRLGEVRDNFLRGMKPQLDRSTMNLLDSGGAERHSRFIFFVRQQEEAARAANQDRYELYNPDSPKYLGKFVARFQTGPQQRQRDLSDRINRSLDASRARRPGETPAEYLKRMEK